MPHTQTFSEVARYLPCPFILSSWSLFLFFLVVIPVSSVRINSCINLPACGNDHEWWPLEASAGSICKLLYMGNIMISVILWNMVTLLNIVSCLTELRKTKIVEHRVYWFVQGRIFVKGWRVKLTRNIVMAPPALPIVLMAPVQRSPAAPPFSCMTFATHVFMKVTHIAVNVYVRTWKKGKGKRPFRVVRDGGHMWKQVMNIII